MKSKSYWIFFTLLAAAQLSLLLLGVVYLFRWFETAKVDAVRSNTMINTRSAVMQIANQLDMEGRSGQGATNSDRTEQRFANHFRRSIALYDVPNRGFMCVLNADSGSIINQHGLPLAARQQNVGQLPFLLAQAEQPTRLPLIEAITNSPRDAAISGSLELDQQIWWASAYSVKRDNVIVLVAQNQTAAMLHGAKRFGNVKVSSLSLAMLLGFFAIAVPMIGLFYYDSNLRQINTTLERQATHNERELVRTQNAVIFGLAKLAESRDTDTGEHLERIRKYVEILCDDLATKIPDIDEAFALNLSLASSLHDIGKVGIPDSILLKPGRLTPEERSVMQIHTVIGGECLDAIHTRLGDNPFMHMARQIAYYHHERWDGQGYPHQLKAEAIPLVARIVAVADVYDALTSKRPYKRAMSHLESRAIVLAGSGSQFDPEIVAAFMRHEDEFEAISRGQQTISDDDATSRFVRLHEMAAAGASSEETS